jgi:exonuclease SbcC
MRLESFTAHNIGTLRDVRIDLAALPEDARIVAITGPNGAGKTTALELAGPGVLHRQTPTRGSLMELARVAGARDASIEATVVNGRRYTIRHLMDAVSGSSEVLVLDSDGASILESTKVSEFDKWATKHLPSPEVYLASEFTAQRSGGFLAMKRSERVGVILRVRGIERLEALAAGAREHAAIQRQKLEVLGARLSDERERLGDDDTVAAVAGAESMLTDARSAVDSTDVALSAARGRLAEAETEARILEELRAEMLRRTQKRAELERSSTAADERLSELRQRITNNSAVMAERAEIERALAELPKAREWVAGAEQALSAARAESIRRTEIVDEIKTAQRNLVELQDRITSSRAELADRVDIEGAVEALPAAREAVAIAERTIASANEQQKSAAASVEQFAAEEHAVAERSRGARARAGAAEERLARRNEVETAARMLEEHRADVVRRKAEVDGLSDELEDLRARLETLRGTRLAGAEERIGGLRGGLSNVIEALGVGDEADAKTHAWLALEADDEVVERAKTVPEELASLEAHIAKTTAGAKVATEHHQAAQDRLVETERTAALAADIALAVKALAEAHADEKREDVAANTARDRLSSARSAVTKACSEVERLTGALLASHARLAKLEALAGRQEQLAVADGRLAELQPRAAATSIQIAQLTAKRDAVPRGAAEEAERTLTIARGRVSRLEEPAARKPSLDAADGRLAELQPLAAQTEAEIARLHAEREHSPEPAPVPEAVHHVPSVRNLVEELEQSVQSARERLVLALDRLESTRAIVERISELETQRRAVETELADWNLMAKDLGRDGLQAIEIDAAGPELTALTNELLHECHGPRFTVRVDTQRLSSDGKRMLEGCDVVVFDAQLGEKLGETLCGGEKVIVGEALSLALSVIGCRAAGVERPTLVRDESGAALDPENAIAYVAMLRHAAHMIRADRVLLVSHDPVVQGLCDARIELLNGAVASTASI